MLSSTSRPIRVSSNSCISLQLVEREYKELGGVYTIGWAGLTQRAWQGTQTGVVQSTKVPVYASVSGVRATRRMLSLHARTKVEGSAYLGDTAVLRSYSGWLLA
jgi:hypothetical protein